MARQLTIKAKPREDKKPNAIRREGFIPATLYGHGFESKSIQINARAFAKIPHKAYSALNQLEIEGDDNCTVLIKDVQMDPVKDKFLNIEFLKIRSDEKVKVKVSLNFIGHSEAVVAGGVLVVSHNEVEIQCLPQDIPDSIEVNLEEIKEIGQSIHIKDLKVSSAVNLLQHPDEILVKVEIPKEHKVEEEVPVEEALAVEGAAVPAEGEAAAPAEGKPEAGKKEESAKDKGK
ncbi:MAG: 50S ribosomal protein L25 [Candidatus Melainabacteria bacterium]|nr:50S ribosomal protein L25 [Candidatus Melainabacteria bacterium]MBI3308210.1 50S ribosomal protein L25 [Candidatus Melainabacteria bacterium]